MANVGQMGMDVENHADDCRMLPRALDELVVDMPLVDLVAMETWTVRAMAKVLAMHGIVWFLLHLPVHDHVRVLHFGFVSNFCSMTNRVVVQMLSMYPIEIEPQSRKLIIILILNFCFYFQF